jgi:hypothetical protein
MDQGTAIADLPDVAAKPAGSLPTLPEADKAVGKGVPVSYIGALRKVDTAALAQVGVAAFAAQSAPLNVITGRLPFLLNLGPTALRCILTVVVFAVLQALWKVR